MSEHGLRRTLIVAGAPEPEPDGSSKVKRCTEWLKVCNSRADIDALAVLGTALEVLLDTVEEPTVDLGSFGLPQVGMTKKAKLLKQFEADGLVYERGGKLRKRATSLAPKATLLDFVERHDLVAVQREFERALDDVERDPARSITAANSMMESVLKCVIELDSLAMPKDESVQPLWKTVRDALGFDPTKVEDDDLKKILGGFGAIVDGLGSLRTHAGSAHGRGMKMYKVEPRHARLAIHAASSLAAFVIETRSQRNASKL